MILAMKKNTPKSEVEKPVLTTGQNEPTAKAGAETTISKPETNDDQNTASDVVSLESIIQTTTDSAPLPNETAIDRIKQKENQEKESQENTPSGPGSNQKGKKRGPYKKKSEFHDPEKEKSPEDEQKEKDKRCYQTGAETIDALVMMAGGFLGPEWNWLPPIEVTGPNNSKMNFDERAQGQQAAGDLFVYYQWDKPTPYLAFIAFSVGFIARRSQMPETKKKVASWKEKIGMWWLKRKAKKEAQPVEKLRDLTAVSMRPEK